MPSGGEAKVFIPFADPTFVGRFVYHCRILCHILAHGGKGMVATIEVAP